MVSLSFPHCTMITPANSRPPPVLSQQIIVGCHSLLHVVDSNSGVDIEISGGIITKESLLGSFSKVSDKMSGSVSSRDPVKEEAVMPAQPVTQEPGQSVQASSSSALQERVERAKMLVEQRKAEKEAAEEDKEKTKEMERREVGKVRRESDIIIVEEHFRVRVSGVLVIRSEEESSDSWLDRLLVSMCCCAPFLF